MVKKRNPAMDVVRIVATFCVVSVHFFLNTDLYEMVVSGWKMYLMCFMREAFMVCVPLFIVLTGYLMCRKQLSRRYYAGITRTLCIYALAGIACQLYLHFYRDASLTPGLLVRRLLRFTAASYGWYIEMYCGLFLLIPFLNVMYRGPAEYAADSQNSRQYKHALIGTFLFLTALPTIANIFHASFALWKNPAQSENYVQFIPAWWKLLYPITYYFIGSYCAEYEIKIRKNMCLLLYILTALCAGSFAYYRSHGATYMVGDWNSWGSVFYVLESFFLFQFIGKCDFSRCPKWGAAVLKTLSGWCLGAYLVSFIFDNAFYPYFWERVPVVIERLKYYPLMAGLVFVCAMLLSGAINLLYDAILKGLRLIFSRKPVSSGRP